MLFNSLEFLIFLPLAFLGFWFVFRKLRTQNFYVLFISYLFYGWWDWRFLFLIAVTTITCFYAGRWIQSARTKKTARVALWLNILFNIGILVVFKYFNFFSESLKVIFEQFGYQLDWFTIDVLLPVGISFYTFQAISYPIDVYRKKTHAINDIVAFSAFISFFPQLVAGPIERSTQLLPQFLRKREFSYDAAVDGMRQMLWGFFKKIVIADNCALIANSIFDNYAVCDTGTLWIGAFFFTFQVYGDFSGYSDIAIGVARLFGFNLSRNFRFPYFSRSIAEFWRRWHISLNSWFMDYIYVPLGGSRCSKTVTYRNIMTVFLLSGLWHGANWTYVTWGAYNGLLIVAGAIIFGKKKYDMMFPNRFFPGLRQTMQIIITFGLVLVGMIIFRSEDVTSAADYVAKCFLGNTMYDGTPSPISGIKVKVVLTVIMIMLMQLADWTQRNKVYGLQIVQGRNIVIRWGCYAFLIFAILCFAGAQEQFIYFQF